MPALDDSASTANPSPIESTSPSSPQVAGKKRKATGTNVRGVASLTSEQLAKKRANDREAQRAIRERTKTQFETLERKIQDLTSQRPYQELQAVLRQKQAIQEENTEIKRTLASVLSIIQPIVGAHGLTELSTAAQTSHDESRTASVAPPKVNGHSTPSISSSSMTGAPEHVQPQTLPLPPLQFSANDHLNDPAWSPINGFNHQRTAGEAAPDLSQSGERLVLNFLLDGSYHQNIPRVPSVQPAIPNHPTAPLSLPYASSPSQAQPSPYSPPNIPPWSVPCCNCPSTCALDTIFLDFLHDRQREASSGVASTRILGPPYPFVSSLLNNNNNNPTVAPRPHPLSKMMTDILSKFPAIHRLPEQVATLYLMYLMMRWQIDPSQESYDRLPEWLCPRPSQLFTPHPIWVDYLPWPRMRDKIIANQSAYPFENHFIPYTTTLSLNWPYEDLDCLLDTSTNRPPTATTMNPQTPSSTTTPPTSTTTTTTTPGPTTSSAPTARDETVESEIIINPIFERHFRNPNNWSLGPAFARAHPELAAAEGVRIKTTP